MTCVTRLVSHDSCHTTRVTRLVSHDSKCLPLFQWLYGAIRELIKVKQQEIHGRRITFDDLFGEADEESEYLRDKRMAENMRSISMKHLLRRSEGVSDVLAVTTQALTALSPQLNAADALTTA